MEKLYNGENNTLCKKLPSVSRKTFYGLADAVDTLTGGTSKYYHNIFIIESLLELRIIRRFIERNLTIMNVYDCFYYVSSEMSTEDIEKIITEEAIRLYDDIIDVLNYQDEHSQDKTTYF